MGIHEDEVFRTQEIYFSNVLKGTAITWSPLAKTGYFLPGLVFFVNVFPMEKYVN